ncbi:hypothetical protein BCR37DRAFT_381448 [Protomyces lactucae-debilis]|uniref:F-box domain-containing protein n=1 Tax=Protomyces lactucae-debilis TaxID=2754530 RepID=A0A1Y2F7W2_PROLT|nr:uncharacterized protein BCR37DRAFT_381448 [Protomyces lactucae-debilis]ORY80000.1 hypothetical protein BCR37DRAFT_381448 [Protomyces lactucae-debilis]
MDPSMFMVLDLNTDPNDFSALWLLVPIFLRMPRRFHLRLVAYLDPISLARLERVCLYWRYFLSDEGEE